MTLRKLALYATPAILIALLTVPGVLALADHANGESWKGLPWSVFDVAIGKFSGDSVFWSTGYRTYIEVVGEASLSGLLKIEELDANIDYSGDALEASLEASGEVDIEECDIGSLEKTLTINLVASEGVFEAKLDGEASWSGVDCKKYHEGEGEGWLDKSLTLRIEESNGGFAGTYQGSLAGSASALLGPEYDGEVRLEYNGSITYTLPAGENGPGALYAEGYITVIASDEEAKEEVIDHIVELLEKVDKHGGVRVEFEVSDSEPPTIEFTIDTTEGELFPRIATALAGVQEGEASLEASLTVSGGEFTLRGQATAIGDLASLAGAAAGVENLRAAAEIANDLYNLELEIEGYTDYPVMAFEAHRKLYLWAAAAGPEEYSVVLSAESGNALYIDGAVTDSVEVTKENIDILKKVVLLVNYGQQASATTQQAGGMTSESEEGSRLTAIAGLAGLAIVGLAGYILLARNRS
ncbi:hypothetical protein [Aeropyrum pernix]|uniref:hypothetical protein n=1 Tax=Aeropyrum pernix TaxID=56636 RepID=UPI0010377055|nr:hypothetical protein [Aeropyrum pernix]